MRVPPHSLDIERALLSCALADRDAFAIAKGIAKQGDFYVPAHAATWAAFVRLFAKGTPIDQVTLRAELGRSGELALVGGDEWLLSLSDTVPWTDNADSYARTVRDFARHRRLLSACAEMHAHGYDPEVDFETYRVDVERALREITTEESDGEPVHITEVLADVITSTEATKKAGKGAVTGLSTGIRKLDEHISGWNSGLLYVVGGRPGMGKSALMTATLGKTVLGAPCLAFSIEMPNRENGRRLIVADAGLDLRDMAQAKLSRDEWQDIMRACARLSDLPLYLDERTRTLDQIVSKARRLKAKHGTIGLIVIDYLQLITGDKRLPREQQISAVTRELKALAKELECPIIALSQLNRECEQRPNKRPQLSDLRESGAIEQDADVILFLYRRGYYAAQMAKDGKPARRGKWEPESDITPGEDDGITEIIVAKHRGGPTGVVRCLFQNKSARFVDLEEPPHAFANYMVDNSDSAC